MSKYVVILFLGTLLGSCNYGNESNKTYDFGDSECIYVKELDKYLVKQFKNADRIEVLSFENDSSNESPSAIKEGVFYVNNLKEKLQLSNIQSDKLLKILSNYKMKRIGDVAISSVCYVPRHTIVFYNRGNAFAFIELCLECKNARTYGGFLNLDFCDEKWGMIRDFLKSIGVKYKVKE